MDAHSEVALFAKGSPPEPYVVTFRREGGKLFVRCTCRAGGLGQLCKHKRELVSGDASRLHDVRQQREVEEVVRWVKETKMAQLIADVRRAEQAVEGAKRRLKRLKTLMAKAMWDGIGS